MEAMNLLAQIANAQPRASVQFIDAWGIVFFISALAMLVSMVVFLGTRTRRSGQAALGYAIMTVGIAILLFLDLPVLGAIVALPGAALALYAYSSIRFGRTKATSTNGK